MLTVTELIEELQQIEDPNHTFVVLSSSEIEAPDVEFVALDELIASAGY